MPDGAHQAADVEPQARRDVRILLADQDESRLEEIRTVVERLGHETVEATTDLDRVGELTQLRNPELAIVGLGSSDQHALDLVTEIVEEARCPVVVSVDREEPAFVRGAAERGVFAYVVTSAGDEAMEGAIDIALRRYADYRGVLDALARRALIERAKGILMERHGLEEHDAFERLRVRARRTNRKVVDVAAAVLEAQPLLSGPPGER